MVVGRAGTPARLDRTGFAAELRVERTLSGDAPPGTALRIGWEQLAPAWEPPFAADERILVVLEPLPGGSLWLRRFPHRRGYAIAALGTAVLRDPDAATVDALADWLALPAGERSREAGVTALARIVRRAQPRVAASAVPRLDDVPGLAGRLSADARDELARTLQSPERPRSLREALLALVGRRRLDALRPAVEALARPGEPLEAPARAALAALAGGMPADTARALLRREDPALRQVAVTHGADALSHARLRRLVVHDPDPAVRLAAAEALLQRLGAAALGDAIPALFDPEGGVRGEVAVRIGALGPEVVPTLRALATGRRAEDLTGVVTALRLAGAPGVGALREIARDHPDPKVRGLARVALGRGAIDPH